MELATPPPAGRAPVTRHAWWLLPAVLLTGSVVTAVAGPDGVRIPGAIAGLVATAAAFVCVRQLLRTQSQLLRTAADFRSSQARHSQQWQQHVASLESRYEAERAVHEAQLVEQADQWQAQLADQADHWQAQFADQSALWQARTDAQGALVARLADAYLPDALQRLRDGDAIDDVLVPLTQDPDASPEFGAELRRVLRTALLAVEEELNRSTSAEQAVISVGNRMHVLTSKLRGRLHELQGEHGRLPSVAQGLMELDQEAGPADCLAASIGVLGGSDRPGRQWQEPQRLLSVVRGGIGRIKDFNRIQVRQLPELGVDGGLVDHLTLIFAHLLDNAARYSPPTEPVFISGKEVPNGVGIEIQDAGKGLSEERKDVALRALDGAASGPGIGGLSEDAHLGLRVVGILARKYGIRVTFADSPWLGTSVIVVVPHRFFSPIPVAAPAAVTPVDTVAVAPATPVAATPVDTAEVARAASPATPAPVHTAPADTEADALETTPGGLPRRRSKRTEPERSAPEAAPAAVPPASAVPPDSSFTGLAAFATAGRETTETPEYRSEESD
ncbi:ATP-binding protein [Streptomyces sp. NPDC002004]